MSLKKKAAGVISPGLLRFLVQSGRLNTLKHDSTLAHQEPLSLTGVTGLPHEVSRRQAVWANATISPGGIGPVTGRKRDHD